MAEVSRQVQIAINGDREEIHPPVLRAINVLADAEDTTRGQLVELEEDLLRQMHSNNERVDKRFKAVITLLTTIASLIATGLITLVVSLIT